MRLLLIRHGETPYNAQQLALGREDVPLTETGRRQARAIAEALGAEGSEAAGAIRAIYASPLQRALATATPLAEALGLPVQADDGLIEMEIGEMEGRPFDEVRRRYPDFLRRWVSEDLADAEMPGGESLLQVQERAWAAIERIRAEHAEEKVVVVSHNFVILTVLCRVLGMPLSQFRSLRQDLAAVSTVDLREHRTTVIALNDRCHLERLEGSAGAT